MAVVHVLTILNITLSTNNHTITRSVLSTTMTRTALKRYGLSRRQVMKIVLMSFLVLGWRQHCISARLEDRRFQRAGHLELLDYTACVKLHQYVTGTTKRRVITNIL